MTKPDKALLWARLAADHPVLGPAYRAGAAASEARIKELEARVAELELFVAQIARRFVPKKMPLNLLRSNCFRESGQARALLKEAEQ